MNDIDFAGQVAIVTGAGGGIGRIDVLVNNAGIQMYGAVDAIADADLERVIDTNYLGPFRLLRTVWPVMRKQGYGRILNVSSNTCLGFGGMAPYASSKSALLGLTADTGREGEPLGIRVNSLLPAAFTRLSASYPDASSTIKTGFNKWLEENFQPEKVATAAVYLVSKAVECSGEHFSAGAGRIARIAHVATEGYHCVPLTPENIKENIGRIRDTSKAQVVTSGAEELRCYQRIAPFSK